ncbi:MAG: hypothetical protein ACNY01_10015, partial [Desulfobacteria bacterium]
GTLKLENRNWKFGLHAFVLLMIALSDSLRCVVPDHISQRFSRVVRNGDEITFPGRRIDLGQIYSISNPWLRSIYRL